MTGVPAFPDFRPVTLDDRQTIQEFLWNYQPATSELTFTNLFIWRGLYGFSWAVEGDWLLLLGSKNGEGAYFLPPIGPPPRTGLVLKLLCWLREAKGTTNPRVERADRRLVAELSSSARLRVEPAREHYDYVYRSDDLISLRGSRYHAKRNHISRFQNAAIAEFVPLGEDNLARCAEFQERWCEWRRCEEDMNLLGEWDAIKEALANYPRLAVQGEAVIIEGRVEAFTFGELLDRETAVVHIEKANPQIPGLYAAINQSYCRKYWSGVAYINREQDLGEEGLRKAKLSYHPHHLVEKFRVFLAESEGG
jgi:hypothetical protein